MIKFACLHSDLNNSVMNCRDIASQSLLFLKL